MRKRFKRSAVLTAGILGLLTAVGMAYFVGSFLADGSHEGTNGSGGTGTKTLAVNLSWENGKLTPTTPVPLDATIVNTSKSQVKFKKVIATFASSASGCEAKWFRVKSNNTRWNEKLATGEGTGEFVYAPGTHTLGDEAGIEVAAPTFTIAMIENEVDQSACEGAPLKLRMQFTE